MPTDVTPPTPDAVCDGGDLDCGSGLLLIIRRTFKPVAPGGVIEVRSREMSVREDLPAWCRMVGHSIVATVPGDNRYTHYFIRKKGEDSELSADLSTARDFEWTVRVRWNEGMHATAFARNHSFTLGQPASFDTEDDAPSAVEYLLGSVGGCLAVGFAWRASRIGVEVRNLEVSVRASSENALVFLGIDDEGNAGLRAIEGTLFVQADADDAQIESLWRETVARSPVTQSIVRKVPFDVRVRKL